MSEYIIAHCVDSVSGVRYDERREEIVRCRDCKEYRDCDATCHSWQWHNWDAPIEVEPDGFCAWACRKSEE